MLTRAEVDAAGCTPDAARTAAGEAGPDTPPERVVTPVPFAVYPRLGIYSTRPPDALLASFRDLSVSAFAAGGVIDRTAEKIVAQVALNTAADRPTAQGATETVVLTDREFAALAPFPVLLASGALPGPVPPDLAALAAALSAGSFRPVGRGRAYVGEVPPRVARVLDRIADVALTLESGGTVDEGDADAAAVERLFGVGVPRSVLASYGGPLGRA